MIVCHSIYIPRIPGLHYCRSGILIIYTCGWLGLVNNEVARLEVKGNEIADHFSFVNL